MHQPQSADPSLVSHKDVDQNPLRRRRSAASILRLPTRPGLVGYESSIPVLAINSTERFPVLTYHLTTALLDNVRVGSDFKCCKRTGA